MLGCSAPDSRTPEGALELAAAAVDARDAAALHRVIDYRARSALSSIAHDRERARLAIEADYPEPERTAALTALGDARGAPEGADLFARRCGEACMSELASQLGAIVSQRASGDELVITTSRGRELRLHRGRDGHMGLVWHTAELVQERLTANRELGQIRENAEVYRRRRALEAPSAR